MAGNGLDGDLQGCSRPSMPPLPSARGGDRTSLCKSVRPPPHFLSGVGSPLLLFPDMYTPSHSPLPTAMGLPAVPAPLLLSGTEPGWCSLLVWVIEGLGSPNPCPPPVMNFCQHMRYYLVGNSPPLFMYLL